MRRRILVLLLGLLAFAAPPSATRFWGQEKKDALPEPTVKVGDLAPDFTLMDTKGKPESLHDFRGKKNEALAFNNFAITGG